MQKALEILKLQEQKYLNIEANFKSAVDERDAIIDEYNALEGKRSKEHLDRVKEACKKVDRLVAQYGNASAKWRSQRKAFVAEVLGSDYD